jgi:hypothetical protein
MNILPSFSPYPSSSLPLTTTDTKGSAWDNEQKKSKIMVAEEIATPFFGMGADTYMVIRLRWLQGHWSAHASNIARR